MVYLLLALCIYMNVFALLLTFRRRYQLFYALLCIECFSNLYFHD